MDQQTESMTAMTAMLLGSGHPIPDDLKSPPTAIKPLRVGAKRHYVLARTVTAATGAIESSGLNLEEVIIGRQVYRVSRAVIGNRREGALRVLTAHTPSKDGRSRYTVVATRQSSWTPEVAGTVLHHAFGRIDEISDGLWHPAKVARITEGPQAGLFNLLDSASTQTDTFAIIGHVLTGPRSEAKMAVLEEALAEYPWLMNASLLVDPNKFKHMRQLGGRAPERWINGFFATHAYLLNLDTVDAVGALVSAPAPQDLHMDTVRAWIKELAVARCSYQWPQRPFVHALVEHFGDWLRGSRSAAPVTAAPQAHGPSEHEAQRQLIEQLQNQLAKALGRAAEATARAEAAEQKLHTCEGQLGRAESRARQMHTENKDLHTQLRELRSATIDLHTASQDAAQEQQDVSHLRDACENAPGILRAPRRWEELEECAKQLPHVSVTAEAVEPALKGLVRHRHSSRILATTWNALRALDAWMAAPTGERGPFQLFLTRHPQRGMPPGRVAGGETAQLSMNDAMRDTRTFLTALGDYRVMLPHIRLNNQGGTNAARLHYAGDDELGVTHVGYIGPHLPNSHTPNM